MTVVDAGAPARAPDVELLGELSGSGYHDAPSLVRRGGQTVQVTPLLYQLLEALDGERDLGQLADELGRRCGKLVTADDVHFLLKEKLVPLGLLAGADGSAPVAQKPSPLLGLKLKVVVAKPEVTRRITGPFAQLFRPWIVVPVLVAFVVTCWWVLWQHGLARATRQAFDSPGMLLLVFALTVASAGWHEFGHAAACRAKGATPGAMGAGLYLAWPAFYTDVDDSYRLSRWGRLVVDLGGLYFNAVAAVATVGAWLVVRQDALLLVVASQLLLMLRQLAPVIRADGYHILADLTGVPDLFHHIRPTLAGLLPTGWRRPQPLRPWARWLVRIWVLVVVPLLIWMLIGAILLLPRLVATAWNGLDEQVRTLVDDGADGDVIGVLGGVLQVLALLVPLAAITYQLVRLVRRGVGKVWVHTEGRPVARKAAVGAGVALAVLAAWAWWPSGQYQPVAADERGTLRDAPRMSRNRAPAFRPIAGVRPRPAYALVPRQGSRAGRAAPTLLLVRSDDGTMRSILTEDGQTGVAFPFELPAAPGQGDNQALAVNTGDGTVVYDIAVALVWVTDGQVADNRNEAYALASCTSCTTVAVAFQVVLVVGQSDVVAPVNVAVAANGGCVQCVTTALAVQLVVTLREMPSEELQVKIEAAIARLDGLESMEDPYGQIKAVEQEILTLLVEAGLVEQQGTAVVTSGPAATTTTPSTATTSTTGPPSLSTTTTAGTSSSTTTRATSTTSPPTSATAADEEPATATTAESTATTAGSTTATTAASSP